MMTEYGLSIHAWVPWEGPIYRTPCGITGNVEEEEVKLMEKRFEEIDREHRCDTCEAFVFGDRKSRLVG